MSPRIAGSAARVGRIGRLRRRVENVAETRDRQPRLVKILPHLRQAQHRRADPARQHVEGDELADRQALLDDELGAEEERRRGDELARRAAPPGSRCCRGSGRGSSPRRSRRAAPPSGAASAARPPSPSASRRPLTLSTRNAWFSAPRANFSSRRWRKSGVDAGGDGDIERKRAKHDDGEERRIDEHHRQEHDGEEEIDDERQRRAGEEVADVLELAHARHRIAGAPRLEIGERQRRADGGTAARPARRRCGSSCARRDRSAGCR